MSLFSSKRWTILVAACVILSPINISPKETSYWKSLVSFLSSTFSMASHWSHDDTSKTKKGNLLIGSLAVGHLLFYKARRKLWPNAQKISKQKAPQKRSSQE